VGSDYGGESTGDYYVYSALACGYGVTGVFNTRMKSIRTEHHLGDKEIAFKDFGMGQLLLGCGGYSLRQCSALQSGCYCPRIETP
jgi:hypothetical protein